MPLLSLLGKIFQFIFNPDRDVAVADSCTTTDETKDVTKTHDAHHSRRRRPFGADADLSPSSICSNGRSYLFQEQPIQFEELTFEVKRFAVRNQLWVAGHDFARGLNFADASEAITKYVDFENVKPINLLPFCSSRSDSAMRQRRQPTPSLQTITCINKTGALQLVAQAHIKNKIRFTAYLMNLFDRLENEMATNGVNTKTTTTTQQQQQQNRQENDKMEYVSATTFNEQLLKTIEDLTSKNDRLINNAEFLTKELYTKIDSFADKMEKLEHKLNACKTIDDLHAQLSLIRRHKKRWCDESVGGGGETVVSSSIAAANATVQNLAFLDECHRDENNARRYETVKFPRDVSKHPRLAVFVRSVGNKSVDNNDNSVVDRVNNFEHNNNGDDQVVQLAFLSGQQRNFNVRKRPYRHMEQLYDVVHPNPVMAIQCINEELRSRNYKFTKKRGRLFEVECDLATLKAFIDENL
nr:38.7K [Calliteara abietis nucleopolyhedrovirus]